MDEWTMPASHGWKDPGSGVGFFPPPCSPVSLQCQGWSLSSISRRSTEKKRREEGGGGGGIPFSLLPHSQAQWRLPGKLLGAAGLGLSAKWGRCRQAVAEMGGGGYRSYNLYKGVRKKELSHQDNDSSAPGSHGIFSFLSDSSS